MSDLMQATDANFKEEVLSADSLVIVDFWADWCTPCHMLTPVIEALAVEYSGKVKIMKLNVDENQETSAEYQVMSIPSVLFFKGGQLVDKLVGVQPKSAYDQVISKHL